jgi:hypothetical protein
MKRIFLAVFLILVTLGMPMGASANGIRGDYLESRTSDVYTGPCFANAEVNLTGKKAVMAWRVREGSWQGVDLSGLAVVAVVKASATLGDPFADPQPARAVVVVDQKAKPEQQKALVDFARSAGGDLLAEVIRVDTAKIDTAFGTEPGYASVKAGDIVELKTRALNEGDHLCGNEVVYYPPLTAVSNAVPAYAVAHSFQGDGLNSKWKCPLKRSAFVAEFAF